VVRDKLFARIIQNTVRNKSKSSFNLSPVTLHDYPIPDLGKNYLLYLHVPFCKTFCSYCSFYKIKYTPEIVKEYFIALQGDIKKAHNKGYKFQGVYIGGGTPTLAPNEVAETIDLLNGLFDIKEVSCEANPDIEDSTIHLLKSRVNRLSVGIQSFQNSFLNKSKRLVEFGESNGIQESLSKIIEHFEIVNVDMIFNFHNQSKKDLLADLDTLHKLAPHQIAYYPLMYSKNSEIKNNYGGYSQKKEFHFYETIMNDLRNDYNQVGSWSFTKKGGMFFDEYVVNHDEYLGLGAGSFSFIDSVLYANMFNVDEYIDSIKNKLSTIKLRKEYGHKDQLIYRLMLRLFADEFDPDNFRKHYGADSIKKISVEINLLKLANAFISNSYSLNQYGKYYAMIMMKEFYIGMNDLRNRLQ